MPEIRAGSAEDLPLLEPLWVAVHRHHEASMPELAPYVSDAESWAARRHLYTELLARPGTVLLLVVDQGTAIGYGLAHVLPAADTWVADTWQTGPRVGEIESVGVLPAYRGQGFGGQLLDGLESALAADGVHDLVLGVLPGNTAAVRLYERRGYRPTWTYLSRFTGR